MHRRFLRVSAQGSYRSPPTLPEAGYAGGNRSAIIYLSNHIIQGDDEGRGGEIEDEGSSSFEDFLDLHGFEWIIVFAYFDETGMHGEAPDTVVAGYLFERNNAKIFRTDFEENILPLLPVNKKGKRIFHASKCCADFGYDEYESMRYEERKKIADLLAEAAIKTVTLGCVMGMEKTEYAKAVKNSPQLADLSGTEYTACLFRCVENMAAWMNENKINGRVLYVFEAGCQHQEEANRFLFRISQSDELKKRYRWHNYAFVEKGAGVPHLYPADLLAWEWQRWRKNTLNPKRNEDRSRLSRMLTARQHIKEYISEAGLAIRALINVFYGVSDYPKRPLEIRNSFFTLKDFDSDKKQ